MSRPADDGFTLLELVVVLAVMGAVIGIVISRGPVHSAGLQTRAAAGVLAQTLRTARATAIDRAREISVVIDPPHRSFAADDGPIHVLAPGVALAFLPPVLKGPRDTGIIRFSPDGSATGGEILLGDGARRVRIDVQWLTGQVQVANAP
jgi:general secretion pathway protein H